MARALQRRQYDMQLRHELAVDRLLNNKSATREGVPGQDDEEIDHEDPNRREGLRFDNRVRLRKGRVPTLADSEVLQIRRFLSLAGDLYDAFDVQFWRTMVKERPKSLGGLVKGRLRMEEMRISSSKYRHDLENRDNFWVLYDENKVEGKDTDEIEWRFGSVRSYILLTRKDDRSQRIFLALVDTLTDISTLERCGLTFVYTKRVKKGEKRRSRLVVMDAECISEKLGLVQSGKRSFIVGKKWILWSGGSDDTDSHDTPRARSSSRAQATLRQSRARDASLAHGTSPYPHASVSRGLESQAQSQDPQASVSRGLESQEHSQLREPNRSSHSARVNLHQSRSLAQTSKSGPQHLAASDDDNQTQAQAPPINDGHYHWSSEDEYFN
ncbi:hypothetical protein BJ508DRAFT_335630 [Ascobolus immersus RN42]|uniref:Uncharacterized protein n=1 Tax=Ascobolus immersus RN42 TaxID=1160509 RepID=A0A3N4HHV2_ASCIM|nr:hypothetical protein BJ508DRAFT_335630 [Ascobolus immersus RN42]